MNFLPYGRTLVLNGLFETLEGEGLMETEARGREEREKDAVQKKGELPLSTALGCHP